MSRGGRPGRGRRGGRGAGARGSGGGAARSSGGSGGGRPGGTGFSDGLSMIEPYRDLIDDWDAFVEAVRRPEPQTLRVNRLRTTVEAVQEELEAEGFELEGLEGQPFMLRVVDGPRSVSDTWGHWAGDFYIQQAATAVAVGLLEPQPGEHILDMCSAPGGKTTHLAEAMDGRGTVIAGEVNDSRIRALLGNLYRLGITNVGVVQADGRTLPTGALFDRVLVDVPCSAQGTIRKKRGKLPPRSKRFMKQVTKSQEHLLRRAIDLTKPGGVILYVTCTFGPEENEAVVSRVLADAPVELEPLDPPVRHARGVTSFDDEAYDPRLKGAVRLYPHHLDSGGLFICRLRKAGGPDTNSTADRPDGSALPDASVQPDQSAQPDLPGLPGWSRVPIVWDPEVDGVGAGRSGSAGAGHATQPSTLSAAEVDALVAEVRDILRDHYGVDETAFEGMSWLHRGENLWLHGCEEWPFDAWDPGGHWRLVALGLRAIDLRGDGPPRPTNDLLQWLDRAITKNRIDLDAQGWRDLLDGRDVQIDAIERGHVALGFDGHIAGWGFVRDHRLQHHIPRGRAKWLRNVVAESEE